MCPNLWLLEHLYFHYNYLHSLPISQYTDIFGIRCYFSLCKSNSIQFPNGIVINRTRYWITESLIHWVICDCEYHFKPLYAWWIDSESVSSNLLHSAFWDSLCLRFCTRVSEWGFNCTGVFSDITRDWGSLSFVPITVRSHYFPLYHNVIWRLCTHTDDF